MHEVSHQYVADSGVSGEDASNKNDDLVSNDLSEIRIDLTDDLLHMVCIGKPPERNLYIILG